MCCNLHPVKPIIYILSYIASLLCSINAEAAYYEGRIRVTVRDSARNKDVPITIIYPADSASGDNRPLIGTGAKSIPTFGVIVMGHGYQMPVTAYKAFSTNICQNVGRYIVVLPETGSGLFPNHNDFALDMVAAAAYMQLEGKRQGSLWKDHIANDNVFAGHSMGGGAAFLAAKQALQTGVVNLSAVIGMAPAETNPSSASAAAFVTCPTLILAGSIDCVTPLAGTVQPIYNNVASSCKTLAVIPGASHCQFADANSTCNLGELNCKATISRDAQLARCWQYINLLLGRNDGVTSKIADTDVQTSYVPIVGRDITYNKTQACSGDTIRCTYSGKSVSVLWLPDSVRGNSYTYIARKGNVRIGIVNTTCFGNSVLDTLITVLDRPTVQIEGKGLLCAGDSVLLEAVTNASASNPQSVRWSTGATTNRIYVHQPGIYTANVNSEFGCGTASAALTVEFVTIPNIRLRLLGDTTQCGTAKPVEIQLEGDVNLVERIAWNTGDTSARIMLKEPGPYTVSASMTLRGEFACNVNSDTISFTIRQVQPTAAEVSLRGDTLWSTPADSYAWSLDGNKITGATRQTYLPIVSGSYSVETTHASEWGCAAASKPVRVTVSSIDAESDAPLLTICDHTLRVVGSYTLGPLLIVDMTGRVVLQYTCDPSLSVHEMNVATLSSGAYAVVANGRCVGRFIRH